MIGGSAGDTGLTGCKIIVDTYGGRAAHGGGAFSGKDSSKVELTDTEIAEVVSELFDLRPAAIIERFGLKNPIYLPTASYGHFGRQPYTENGIEFFGRNDWIWWRKSKKLLI